MFRRQRFDSSALCACIFCFSLQVGGLKEAGMWFRHLGSPVIELEQRRQSLCCPLWCLLASVHYSRVITSLSLSLWVCKRLWHASVNTVHTTLRTPHLLAPAGTDEAAGETVRLRGAVAVACAVPQLLPLHAGVRE